jgi:hypothetical protein
MRGIIGFMTFLLLPIAAGAQQGDPINRPVSIDELSGMYKQHSDNKSNKEFEIQTANGTAQSAAGTHFKRDGKEYEIAGKRDVEDTYDAVKSDTFQRVIYAAYELGTGTCTPPTVRKGPEFQVTIDYRPLQPASFEAYVAEVNRKTTSGERWEFTKVRQP